MTNTHTDVSEKMAKAYVDYKLTEHARVDSPLDLALDKNDTNPAALNPTIIIPMDQTHGTEVVDNALSTTIANYCQSTGTSFDADKSVLHVLADMIFNNRSMMVKDNDLATQRYLNNYETLNTTILDNIDYHLALDDFDEHLQESFYAMLYSDIKRFDAYINSSDKFGLLLAFKDAVSNIITESDIHMEIRDLTSYRPLDIEMARYGDDALIRCWIAPGQEENHNTEGMQLATDMRLLVEGFDGESLEDNDAVSNVTESLFLSQGYTLHECIARSNDRAFPVSLKQEVSEMTGQITQIAFLTVCAFISVADLDATMRGKTNALVIPAESPNHTVVPVGVFEPVNGGGSLFGIDLERDWIVPLTPAILGASFGGVHTDEKGMSGGYGYSPSEVYGDITTLAQIHTTNCPWSNPT